MRNYTVSYYNPFRHLEDYFTSPNDFFTKTGETPIKIDVVDNGNGYTLTADLPGFKKEDLHLDIDGDMLTLKAERHSDYEDEDKKKNYLHCERSYGCYTRSFDLTDIDAENIHAKYTDGVLTLELPKKEIQAPTARRLEIE